MVASSYQCRRQRSYRRILGRSARPQPPRQGPRYLFGNIPRGTQIRLVGGRIAVYIYGPRYRARGTGWLTTDATQAYFLRCGLQSRRVSEASMLRMFGPDFRVLIQNAIMEYLARFRGRIYRPWLTSVQVPP